MPNPEIIFKFEVYKGCCCGSMLSRVLYGVDDFDVSYVARGAFAVYTVQVLPFLCCLVLEH